MNIPKHVLNCPWVGQQHDILSFCEHLILRLWSIFSQNDNSDLFTKIDFIKNVSVVVYSSTLFLYAYKVKNQNSINIVKIGYTYPISAMHRVKRKS